MDASIPLLIGSNAMEVGGAVLNFQSNTATFFEEEVDMVKVGTGHFCIDLVSQNIETHINDIDARKDCIQHALVSTEKLDAKKLKKLHHYYGHTSADRLMKFLENAGKDTKDLKETLSKIEKSCEACIRTKRRKPKPRSAIPRVEGPNDIVTIDLKEWKKGGKNRYICYMIDMHSRLTLGNFISDKKPDSIVQCIMRAWVPVFGLMYGIHSDIGGEVSNNIMEDVAHKLGVKLTTTASYSPHQNGLNERNHMVVDMMITRMMYSDKNLLPEMALLWALNAKNSLENCYGFSPFQLHIGRNPVLSSTTRDGPPSYETVTKSKSFASHLNAMHSAREEFIKAESSTSLKKALKCKVHPKGDDIIEGDWIFYKKNDGKSKSVVWNGPLKVVSINGKKLFVDQGARLGTVNRDDAVRKGEELWRMSDFHGDQNDQEIDEGIANVLRKVRQNQTEGKVSITHTMYASSDSESEDEDEENESVHEGNVVSDEDLLEHLVQEFSHSDDNESGHEGSDDGDDEDSHDADSHDEDDEDSHDDNEDSHDADDNEEERGSLEVESSEAQVHAVEEVEEVCDNGEHRIETIENTFACNDIRAADVITYQIPKTGVVERSKVLSRAAKSTGSNKFWWNVEVQNSGEVKSINTAAVKDLLKVDGDTYTDIIENVHALVVSIPRHLHNEPECIAAKEKELQNWDDFGVYMEIEDLGQKTLNTNWVLVKKDEGVKARLCIRGDQEIDKENIRTDSPTVNKINIKLFYLLAGHFGWNIKTADVKAAFLQGAALERDVFVRPPTERRVPGMI